MPDLEKTVAFLLEQQAQTWTQVRGLTADVRGLTAVVQELTAAVQGLEGVVRGVSTRQAKTDRRVDALAKLVQTGMKMLVKIEKDRAARDKVVDSRFNSVVDAQLRTERKLDRLIDALLRANRNGR